MLAPTTLIRECEPILYDPGIPGFVKAHRHPSGSSLVMTTVEEDDTDWISVFWVKRLHYAAKPVENHKAWSFSCSSLKAAERAYELLLSLGPPLCAVTDFQRSRVYTWEDVVLVKGWPALSLKKCQEFLDHVWGQIGGRRKKPRFKPIKNGNPHATHDGEIQLPEGIILKDGSKLKWRTKPVILHEIAHILLFEHQHGPKWVAKYIDLCVRFLGMDRRKLESSADLFGVIYR